MHSIYEYFALIYGDKCLLDAAFTHTEWFYLRSVQHQAGFIFLFHEIIMKTFLLLATSFCASFAIVNPLFFMRQDKIYSPCKPVRKFHFYFQLFSQLYAFPVWVPRISQAASS